MSEAALVLQRCQRCGHQSVTPLSVCPICLGESFEAVHQDATGTCLSWTRIRRPATGFESDEPFIVAVARLQNGMLVTGRLAQEEAADPDLEIGAPVVVTSQANEPPVIRRVRPL